MADLLASLLGSDPEELACQAVACGRIGELERFSTEVLHHMHLSRSSSRSTAAGTTGGGGALATPAAGASASAASAVPAVTPSYEGIGLLDEMAAFSDEEGDKCNREKDSSKPAAVTLEQTDNYGDEDSVATVPRSVPIGDDGGDDGGGDEVLAAPFPVVAAAAPAAAATSATPGAKFQVNERVIVLGDNRGYYVAMIKDVRPNTDHSGRCRHSKVEYFLSYEGYPSEWDRWMKEEQIMKRNDETLKLVALREKNSAPNRGRKSVLQSKVKRERIPRPSTKDKPPESVGRFPIQRRKSKRKRGNSNVTNPEKERSSDRRSLRRRSKRNSISISNPELTRSEGRTRDELNDLDKSSDFRRMDEKTGIFAKFGMSTVATKGGSVSHIVINDEWNKLVSRRDEMQDLEFGLGAGRARAAGLLASVGSAGVPFFHAPKVAEKTRKIFYVGHWAPVQSGTMHYRRSKTFMGKPRQMRVQLIFVRYDEKIDKVMMDGHL